MIEEQVPLSERVATDQLATLRDVTRLRAEAENEKRPEARAVQLALLETCMGGYDAALTRLDSTQMEGYPLALAASGSARLSRGIRDKSTVDLLRAANDFRQALKYRPTDLSLLTNYSEVLGRLELVDLRRSILSKLSRLETSESWRAVHKRELLHLEQRVARYRAGEEVFRSADSVLRASDINAQVAEYPYLARKLVEESLLGDWAEAWQREDSEVAERSLLAADEISLAILELTGDPVLHEAALSIRRSEGHPRTQLAKGFAAFREGMRIYRGRDQEPNLAIRHFEQSANELRSRGVSFALLAEHYALVLRSHSDREGTTARWQELYDQIPKSYLALRGHFAWRLGIARQMSGNAAGALPFYRESIKPLEAVSGERGAAFSYALIGNSFSDLDLVEQSWKNRLVGLRRILVTSDRWQRHSILHGAAHSLIRSHEPGLAFPFLEELEINDREWGFRSALAELYFLKARAHSGVAEYKNAMSSVAQGRAAIAHYPAGAILDWLEADGDIAEGLALVHKDPHSGASLLNRGHASQQGLGYMYEKVPVLGGLAAARKVGGDLRSSIEISLQLSKELSRLRTDLTQPADRAVSGIALGHVVEQLLAEEEFDDDNLVIQTTDLLKPRPTARAGGLTDREDCPDQNLVGCLQQQLAVHELVLTYHIGQRQLLIGVIRRSGSQLLRRAVDRKTLVAEVRRFRRDLGEVNSNSSVGQSLWTELLGAIDLTGIKRLIVVPDLDLQSLPFQALPLPSTGRPVISEFEVVYYPSLSSMQQSRSRPQGEHAAATDSILLVAEPILDPVLRTEFPDLPFARSEVDRLAELYPSHQILLGTEASIDGIRTRLPGSTIAHFAVHAVPGGPGAAFAGLVLSPGQRATDGVLTLNDLNELELAGLDLVVLSGCSTAKGFSSGRAVLWGLPTAALDAGVRSVLATTVEIKDREASLFAVEFHRRYLSAHDAVAAYALAARAEYERHSETPALRPSIWANYNLIGD